MPRQAGQIDVRKHAAILEAAAEVLAERGLAASLEEVARRAGVSKQTVYNHYGSKADLVAALTEQRRRTLTALFDLPGAVENPAATLQAYAEALLEAVSNPSFVGIMRVAVAGAREAPEIGRAMYDAGTRSSRAQLAAFLAAEDRAGRLAIPEPDLAAEVFSGMVYGARLTPELLGLATPLDAAARAARAREVTARFLRAYAP